MDGLDLINFSALSRLLDRKDRKMNKKSIPRKHQDKIKELDDLINYWKKRHNL